MVDEGTLESHLEVDLGAGLVQVLVAAQRGSDRWQSGWCSSPTTKDLLESIDQDLRFKCSGYGDDRTPGSTALGPGGTDRLDVHLLDHRAASVTAAIKRSRQCSSVQGHPGTSSRIIGKPIKRLETETANRLHGIGGKRWPEQKIGQQIDG